MQAKQSFTASVISGNFGPFTDLIPVGRVSRDRFRPLGAHSVRAPKRASNMDSDLGQERSGLNVSMESKLLLAQKGRGLLIGWSPETKKIYSILPKVTASTVPVLILGERGTGKERVARAIHRGGPNADKPFVPVDCRSLVPELIASELFGHVKGAFAGANIVKEGLLSAVGGGTVFLDEIAELPLDLQARLLRALHEKEVRPTGATHAVPISARVLAATSCDLNALAQQGRFRKDLYCRLNVVNLTIPPLRERRMDIAVLAAHFMEELQRETNATYSLSAGALDLMTEYDWPGNMRELENAIEGAVALSSGPVLQMNDLPIQLQDFHARRRNVELALMASETIEDAGGDMGNIVTLAELEKFAILGTIVQLGGDKLMAAKLLGIGKTTLYRKLKEYGVDEEPEAIVTPLWSGKMAS
jgi:DNA-binding NtrC family response regulator